jgi:adenine-specific DNA methylase
MTRPPAWKDAPSLIERLFPAQKISAEAQKERKAVHGQTLTALGSYWKGRKPLILVKACVLGALLPATGDSEKDLEVFESLMAIDDRAFLRREPSLSPDAIARRCLESGALRVAHMDGRFTVRGVKDAEWRGLTPEERQATFSKAIERGGLQWSRACPVSERNRLTLAALATMSYLEKLDVTKRPEQLADETLFGPAWDRVNAHLGTSARSFPELTEQLGVMRFGHRPRVGDAFCGGGSIPFEAARLGCDVFASDLNPIACLLTWGALNIVGGDAANRERLAKAKAEIVEAVDREITELGIEHDEHGNRAKAYLWCLETRCPQTGWMIPMAPGWVISKNYRTCARLIPDRARKRFDIEIVTDATPEDLAAASVGTLQDGDLVYGLDGEIYRTPIKTIRGDYDLPNGQSANRLRRWEKADIVPRPDDIFQERLYCIQWITKDTLDSFRPKFYFAAPTEADLERERRVEAIVRANLADWHEKGLVPDLAIEPGEKTLEPIRTRGWTLWHHLFPPRHLLFGSMIKKQMNLIEDACLLRGAALGLCRAITWMSKLTRWNVGFAGRDGVAPSADTVKDVFYNQAINTLYSYGSRSCFSMRDAIALEFGRCPLNVDHHLDCSPASRINENCQLFISDPPYADAIHYHEITEYFIAWLRKDPPQPDWIWDSRRALAIKGSDEDFRREMVEAYRAMAGHMPDNGLQIVMFTHQDAGVWADMASIVWGAGLRVTAAWYIATETTSELKKGGYVQGTVLLVLRKRLAGESTYRDELVQEVRAEVARQIETMVGLNQATRGHGRSENLFEDADLQMAGYAAALRVLTGYTRIDGQDMTAEALRPRAKGQKGVVGEIIDFAVQVANEHLVPEGLPAATWERLTGPERFYLKMVDLEMTGVKKLDNYQNFAKAFRFANYTGLMASLKPNAARLKTVAELKRGEFETEFGRTPLRGLLYALYELEREVDADEVLGHLRDLVPGYHTRREDLIAMARYLAARRERTVPGEAQAARILLGRIQNERLGG